MNDDEREIKDAAALISVPKHAPADSFVLHAPLELLARGLLLPFVDLDARPVARDRVRWLAETYRDAGEPVSDPLPVEPASAEDAVRAFTAAIALGDLDDVDALAHWLGSHLDAGALQRALAAPVASSLAAAGHASILLQLLPRLAWPGTNTGCLLRGPARELARHPEWRLRWFEAPAEEESAHATLANALLDVPMLGPPGSNFIYPIMNQAEESGIAAKLLTGLTGADPASARRDLSRVAALSMLQEPPDEAPYGWTHCLTMPQAVIALAQLHPSPSNAVAIAATHVVGFRAALGQRTLDPAYTPPPVRGADIAEAIEDGRDTAASVAWHAPDDQLDRIITELATRAATHHDAHLVKYTLACFDAAAADPSRRRLYLAAAASLSSWWAHHPDHTFG